MRSHSWKFWSVFVAAALFRVGASFFRAPPPAGDCLSAPVHGTAFITEDPARTERGQVFVMRASEVLVASSMGEGIRADTICARDLLIRARAPLYPRYAYGDQVAFAGRLTKPFNFSSDNGRTFNYSGYLAKDDVYYEIKAAHLAPIATTTDLFDVHAALFGLKRRFVTHLERALGEPHAALAAGLVVGEKSALGKDLLEDFRIVGLIHIVVLSGFNITIVGVTLRRLLSFLPRTWGIVIGGIGITLFGALVGGGATVVRSCFMAGIALVADLIRRDYSVGRALLFAGLVMLIQNPMILLHDPSFQLSFLATAGLILLAGPIEQRLSFIPERFGMRSTVATCLATQLFVSPYILYMMGQISLVGIVVNILVLPFIPATMGAVFLTGALGFIHPVLSLVAGWGTHILLAYELFMVTTFARLPYAAAYVPPFSFWWVVAFYVGFGVVFVILTQRRT